MDSTETSILIPPYGGKLVNLLVQGDEIEELKAYANALPSLVLSDRSVCDLELLATGAFSPLGRFMAQATVEIIKQNLQWGDFKAHWKGIYHLASTGAASRYAWAKAVLHHAGHDPPPKLAPALSEELPAHAERPKYSVLDCTKLEETFGIRLPDWRDDLSLALSARHLPDFVPAELRLVA